MLKTPGCLRLLPAGTLCLLAAHTFAAPATVEPVHLPPALILELRYCECLPVTREENSWIFAADFLEITELSQAAVSLQQSGRVVTTSFFSDYRLDPGTDGTDTLLLSYTVAMDSDTSGANARATGHVRIALDEWIPLLLVSHQRHEAPSHFSVIARLVQAAPPPLPLPEATAE